MTKINSILPVRRLIGIKISSNLYAARRFLHAALQVLFFRVFRIFRGYLPSNGVGRGDHETYEIHERSAMEIGDKAKGDAIMGTCFEIDFLNGH